MREISFDTETTGFDPFSGDRIVEIGCVELMNGIPTGNHYHQYINPERDMPESAFRVHGLSEEFLVKHPPFAEVADAFVEFVGDAVLIAHNAEFDMKFINWELDNAGRKGFAPAQSKDTLAIARVKFPGAQNSLDALCRRFGIDNSNRTLHGALLDAELLAEVYLELIGGRQAGLELVANTGAARATSGEREVRPARPHAPTDEELAAHKAFMKRIKEPLWES